MVLYEYEGPGGAKVERDFPMGQARDQVMVGGAVYRRFFSMPNLSVSKRVTAYSLPDQRTMPSELKGYVDRWTGDGAPVFTSKSSAKRFGEASRRLHGAGKIDREWHFDNAPTAAEARQAREAKVKKYRKEMLERPRPKDL